MPRKTSDWRHGDAAGYAMARYTQNPPTGVNLDHLTPETRHAVLNYEPLKMPREDWLAVREQTLMLVAYLEPDRNDSTYRALRLIAAYLYGLSRDGMDVAAQPLEVLFDAHRVESYASGLRIPFAPESEMRVMRAIAKELNPGGAWPVARKPHPGAGRLGAYTAQEVLDVFGAIDGMRNGKSKDRQTVITNIVLGCGASPSEVVVLEWEMFEARPDGILIAHLPGGTNRRVPVPPRDVPVADPYRAVVARLAAERTGKVVPHTDVNELGKAVCSDSLSMRSAPRLQVSRFRATWMVERARAGANWVDIAALGGVVVQSLAQVLRDHIEGDPEALMHERMTRSGR